MSEFKELNYDALQKMDRLHRVIKECLRMNPPLIFLMRKALVDVKDVGSDFVVPKVSSFSPSSLSFFLFLFFFDFFISLMIELFAFTRLKDDGENKRETRSLCRQQSLEDIPRSSPTPTSLIPRDLPPEERKEPTFVSDSSDSEEEDTDVLVKPLPISKSKPFGVSSSATIVSLLSALSLIPTTLPSLWAPKHTKSDTRGSETLLCFPRSSFPPQFAIATTKHATAKHARFPLIAQCF